MRTLRAVLVAAVWFSIACAAARASDPGVEAARAEGLVEYESGHYAAAVRHFRTAAGSGDVRSAEMLCLMHRFGATLYGGQVPASPADAARWAAVAAQRRLAGAATPAAPDR